MRVLCLVLLGVLACAPPRPGLRFAEETPGDLRALAAATYDRVAAAFPARRHCLGGVTVAGARILDERAQYRPAEGRIVVRIPATAGQLESTLVHELAHRLEFACAGHAELRPAFLAAQGLPADTPWFEGSTWEETPSEQFAAAVVRYVLGSHDGRQPLPPGHRALAAVEAWAKGEALTQRPSAP